VILYGLTFACAKLVQYALFLWLPYYLKSLDFNDSSIGLVASSCDIGGIAGSVVCGSLSDRLRRRGTVIGVMLLTSIPLLGLLKVAPSDVIVIIGIAFLVGAFTGGPTHIISSACAADIASRGEVQLNKRALATVTGIIDGIGGLGAGLGQAVIGVIAETSWNGVFLFLMGMM
jgi:sugar phosphate permease